MLRVASIKLFRARNAFPNPLPLLRSRRFSAAAPSDCYAAHRFLANALDSEIKHTQMISLRPAAPADFPFKLQHTSSDRVTLTRELDGEEIEVRLLGNDQNQNDADDDDGATTTDSDSDDCSDSDEESPARSATDLIIEISKPNGKLMKFFATASADKIEIQRLTTKDGDGDNSVICSQLFIAPESELQMAFREFLEVRGIKKSIAEFLYDYMNWKSKLPDDGTLRSVESYSAGKFVEQNLEILKKLKKVIKHW